MTANFDIYSIIKKADAKDRATIFFDELLSMSILNKGKFSNAEIEALSDSFKNNADINLYNSYLHDSIYSLFLITQIEREIIRIEYLSTYLRFYNLSKDDQFTIDYLLSDTSKKLQNGKNSADKKQIKKAFEDLSSKIREFCFLSFSDKVVEKFTTNQSKRTQQDNLTGDDTNSHEELFIKFFTDSISIKTQFAKEVLNQLKIKYNEFEVRFEVVGDKIRELENKLKNYGEFKDSSSEVSF